MKGNDLNKNKNKNININLNNKLEENFLNNKLEENSVNNIINNKLKRLEEGSLNNIINNKFKKIEEGSLNIINDEEYKVKTCCGNTTTCDKNLLQFLAKTTVSFSVLSFCFLQLSQGKGDSSYLSSTISLILGTYLGSSVTHNENTESKTKI